MANNKNPNQKQPGEKEPGITDSAASAYCRGISMV